MIHTEDFLLILLQTKGILSNELLEHLNQWWQNEKKLDEDLSRFLLRFGLINKSELRHLESYKKGFLSGSACIGGLEAETIERVAATIRNSITDSTKKTDEIVTKPITYPEVMLNPTRDLSNAAFDRTKSSGSNSQDETPWKKSPAANRSKISKRDEGKRDSPDDDSLLRLDEVVREPAERSRSKQSSKSKKGMGDQDGFVIKPGSVLGKCLITEAIGKGGNGTVFRALHQTLNISVAIKVLRPTPVSDDSLLNDRLRIEAQLLARLNHPNVVRVLDFDTLPVPYVVLEYVEGLSLAELIEQSGRLMVERAIDLLAQACRGLASVTEYGIVHRDVKPANLLIAKQGGYLKLADFGLAYHRDHDMGEDEGTCMGTAAYISPEQVMQSDAIDFRADIYSLGATFYHALTGQIPFQGRSLIEMMMKRIRELPPSPASIVRGLPTAISNLIMEMMATRPLDRPHSYQEIVDKIEEIQKNPRLLDGSEFSAPSKDQIEPDRLAGGVFPQNSNLSKGNEGDNESDLAEKRESIRDGEKGGRGEGKGEVRGEGTPLPQQGVKTKAKWTRFFG